MNFLLTTGILWTECPTELDQHCALRPIGDFILWKNIIFLVTLLTILFSLSKHFRMKSPVRYISTYSRGNISHNEANKTLHVLYGRPHILLRPLRISALLCTLWPQKIKPLPSSLQDVARNIWYEVWIILLLDNNKVTRSHPFKIIKHRFRTDICQHFFTDKKSAGIVYTSTQPL